MPAFEYIALDTRGKQKRGLLEGDTPRQVRQQLRDQGLTPLEVSQVGVEEKKRTVRSFVRRGVSSAELALFTRQLATLAQSGIPLEQGLLAISQQTESQRMQATVLAVRARVVEGRALSAALGEFPNVFSQMYVATVDAGERSGHLDGVLERLADYVETRQELQRKATMALIYPLFLVGFTLLIVGLLMTYVVPKIVTVYEGIDQALPLLTRIVIALSNFLSSFWWLLIIATIAVIAGARALLRNEANRRAWHRFQLRLPVVGRLIRSVDTARFTKALSIQIGSGVPALDAMQISAQVITNLPMRDSVEDAARRVREGATINRALAVDKLFPPITLHLIASGEASGRLDDMLNRASVDQEREAGTMISAMMAILEPVLILLMAVMVLAIVLAILLPIFNLNQLVK